MRKIAVVVILAVALLSWGMAFAFQNEPKGFRKLYWGNSPTSTMEFIDNVDEMLKVYSDPSAENSIGSVGFYRMFYAFYVDLDESLKFVGVTLYYNSEKNFDTLKTLCTQRFGEASNKGYQQFFWEGITTTIHLMYDSIEENGWLSFDSTRLWRQYTERKEQKQVEDAEGDW